MGPDYNRYAYARCSNWMSADDKRRHAKKVQVAFLNSLRKKAARR